MLKLVFLTPEFFQDYHSCREIMHKTDRPHVQLLLKMNGVLFCLPLRSNIEHKHVVWTDQTNKCGIDLSKAVVITDQSRYIDSSRSPRLRKEEFSAFKRLNTYDVQKALERYIRAYKKAKQNPEQQHNKILLQYSTLQYFEQYI